MKNEIDIPILLGIPQTFLENIICMSRLIYKVDHMGTRTYYKLNIIDDLDHDTGRFWPLIL